MTVFDTIYRVKFEIKDDIENVIGDMLEMT